MPGLSPKTEKEGMALTTIQFTIEGMHCIGCQQKIEQRLMQTDGIRQISVSNQTGNATVVFDETVIRFSEIQDIVSALGYTACSGTQSAKTDIGMTIGFAVIIIALFVMLQQFGILNLLVPSRLAESGMGYGMLFVVGLFTSVHCIAMCGGIHLSQCIPRGSGQEKPSFRNSLFYNLGRVCSYTLIGFLLGCIGMLLGGTGTVLADWMQGLLKLLAGILMVTMGVNLLGIFPQVKRIQLHLPKELSGRIRSGKAHMVQPFLIGMLNGLMPCGPLQSMQILALASGSPIAGGFSMLAFSLGTVPLMLGLGTVIAALGRRFSQAVMQIGAVLVAVMGLAMLSQGGSLSGWFSFYELLYAVTALAVIGILANLSFSKQRFCPICIMTAAAVFLGGAVLLKQVDFRHRNGNIAQIRNGVQVVYSTLSPGGYPDITVQAGIPVEWTIDAPEGSINGCNYWMMIREYGISHTFSEGENVITFTPTESGTVSYSCWMGMMQGTILVTDG